MAELADSMIEGYLQRIFGKFGFGDGEEDADRELICDEQSSRRSPLTVSTNKKEQLDEITTGSSGMVELDGLQLPFMRSVRLLV